MSESYNNIKIKIEPADPESDIDNANNETESPAAQQNHENTVAPGSSEYYNEKTILYRKNRADKRMVKCDLCYNYVMKEKMDLHRIMIHGGVGIRCGQGRNPPKKRKKDETNEQAPTCITRFEFFNELADNDQESGSEILSCSEDEEEKEEQESVDRDIENIHDRMMQSFNAVLGQQEQEVKPQSDRARARGCIRGIPSRPVGRRVATSAVKGEFKWRRGDPVVQLCQDEEHVPPLLRDMVRHLESTRECTAQTRERQNLRVNEEDSDDDDEHYIDESYVAHELFGGDEEALKFQWSPMATFSGRSEEFLPEHTGPTCNASCAYEAFRQYWDDDILEHIVRETNRYASQLKLSSSNFARDWYDTNVHEILILFAFWIMLGVIRMPSIKICFTTTPLLKTGIFRNLMTQKRYWRLTRALHFVDNSTRTTDSYKLFCLGPVVDHLNKKFMECYVPDQDITIDESSTLWKDIMSTKRARFGVKTFELCESATGYLWSFFIDTGKDYRVASTNILPKRIEVVLQLVRPLLNKGYRLFLDNWFNSPVLARFCKRNKTDCVGTLRKSRKHVPAIIQLASLPNGACVARYSGDVVVMVYQEKKPIYTVSTFHGTESVQFNDKPSRPAHYKPAVIVDYKTSMAGVVRKEEVLETYLLDRKRSLKWYQKMFKRLLNASIFNSRILVDRSPDNPVKQQAFRLELVQELITRHLDLVPKTRQRQTYSRGKNLPEGRLIGSHFIVRAGAPGDRLTNTMSSNSNRTSNIKRYNCLWCFTRENRCRKTVYECDSCEVPLCLHGCFKNFHTIE